MPPLQRKLGAKRDQGKKSSSRRPTRAARLREELRKANARLELLESLPLGSVEWSVKERRILRWSKEATRIFGWTAEETVGRRIDEVGWIHPEDRAATDRMGTRIAAGTAAVAAVARNRNLRKDGAVIHCDWYSSVLRDDSGAPAVLSLVHDVTDRVRCSEALRADKERMESLLENSPVAVIEFESPEYRIVRWSEGATRLFGWTAEERIGKTLHELNWAHPDDRHLVDGVLADMLRGARPRNVCRNRNVRKDGRVIHCEWHNSAFRNASGNFSVLSLVSDVTERVQSSEALGQSEERFRAALKGSPVSIATLDRELRFTWSSNAVGGLAPEQVLGKRFDEALHVEDGPASEAGLRRALETGEPSEGPVTCRVGERRVHYHARCAPLRDRDGTVVGLLVSTIDLTSQKHVEDALQRSEERFRAALQGSPVTVAVLDRELRYTWIYNPPHGVAEEEVIGRRPDELADLEDDLDIAAVLLEVLETGVPDVRQIDGTALGRPFRSQVRAEPVRGAGGEVLGLILTLIDLTEQRKAEEALREADRRKNEFLATLSHELRNPLSAIKANLYLLDRVAADSQRYRHSKEVIARQADHLALLVDDLLDLTRISRGKVELNRGRVDLREVVRTAVDDLRAQFEDRGVGVELALPPMPVLVEADRQRMGQVVGNLLHNAAKFTPAGGSARAEVALENGQAVLRVSDTGVGVDPATLERLFEPFMQADRSLERASGGLGLGLALVRSLVELHGGRVSAHSEGEGKGSTFTVCLPLAPGAEAVAAGTPVSAQRGHRVLVIEDNVDLAEALRDILQVAGHEVAVAFDGPTGVAKAQELLPEAVFCDIGLPGMNGYEVARKLRACPELAETILVALSGYAQPDDLRKAREAGFARHLAKPPRVEAIEALVDGLPRRAH